jgi:phage tail protein X
MASLLLYIYIRALHAVLEAIPEANSSLANSYFNLKLA